MGGLTSEPERRPTSSERRKEDPKEDPMGVALAGLRRAISALPTYLSDLCAALVSGLLSAFQFSFFRSVFGRVPVRAAQTQAFGEDDALATEVLKEKQRRREASSNLLGGRAVSGSSRLRGLRLRGLRGLRGARRSTATFLDRRFWKSKSEIAARTLRDPPPMRPSEATLRVATPASPPSFRPESGRHPSSPSRSSSLGLGFGADRRRTPPPPQRRLPVQGQGQSSAASSAGAEQSLPDGRTSPALSGRLGPPRTGREELFSCTRGAGEPSPSPSLRKGERKSFPATPKRERSDTPKAESFVNRAETVVDPAVLVPPLPRQPSWEPATPLGHRRGLAMPSAALPAGRGGAVFLLSYHSLDVMFTFFSVLVLCCPRSQQWASRRGSLEASFVSATPPGSEAPAAAILRPAPLRAEAKESSFLKRGGAEKESSLSGPAPRRAPSGQRSLRPRASAELLPPPLPKRPSPSPKERAAAAPPRNRKEELFGGSDELSAASELLRISSGSRFFRENSFEAPSRGGVLSPVPWKSPAQSPNSTARSCTAWVSEASRQDETKTRAKTSLKRKGEAAEHPLDLDVGAGFTPDPFDPPERLGEEELSEQERATEELVALAAAAQQAAAACPACKPLAAALRTAAIRELAALQRVPLGTMEPHYQSSLSFPCPRKKQDRLQQIRAAAAEGLSAIHFALAESLHTGASVDERDEAGQAGFRSFTASFKREEEEEAEEEEEEEAEEQEEEEEEEPPPLPQELRGKGEFEDLDDGFFQPSRFTGLRLEARERTRLTGSFSASEASHSDPRGANLALVQGPSRTPPGRSPLCGGPSQFKSSARPCSSAPMLRRLRSEPTSPSPVALTHPGALGKRAEHERLRQIFGSVAEDMRRVVHGIRAMHSSRGSPGSTGLSPPGGAKQGATARRLFEASFSELGDTAAAGA
ncbi:unnamed protein product [Polarella glacialis]|uniref:Uncharacterized protein n=2 Tax=Polarella glacialis TaxID=89957 RepID=A0A813FGN0_POLGL|nr:unnamed protein product [Polarella glacialis]